MLAKIVAFLTLTSIAALLFNSLREGSSAAALEEEIVGQLDALRLHLFKS